MKFKIWNFNYFTSVENGRVVKLPFADNLKMSKPWILKCPDGRVFNEATHDDAVMRMNIVINEVPV